MNIEIVNTPLSMDIHGFSGTAINKDYAGTAFRLMDAMWKIVKSNDLNNKGLNIWVYEPGDKVFAGVELNEVPPQNVGLERKTITLEKFARYKHVGSYSMIKQAGINLKDELIRRQLTVTPPYVEIYGHWTNDESKLETDLLMAIV